MKKCKYYDPNKITFLDIINEERPTDSKELKIKRFWFELIIATVSSLVGSILTVLLVYS